MRPQLFDSQLGDNPDCPPPALLTYRRPINHCLIWLVMLVGLSPTKFVSLNVDDHKRLGACQNPPAPDHSRNWHKISLSRVGFINLSQIE